MPVRTNLGALRKGRGFGATELARIAGISRQTLHAIEAGAYVPNTAVALRLAQTLGVRVEAIFALEEQKGENGPVSAELIEPEQAAPGMPVRLVRVGQKSIAIPTVHSEYFVAPYEAFLKTVLPGEAAIFERVGEEEAPGPRLVLAGCDPAAPILAGDSGQAGVDLVPWHSNTTKALQLLGDGYVHVAGCHFGQETGDAAAFAKLLPGAEFSVVTLATWEEGLVVATGNPKSIRAVADLANPKLTVVNREIGAGSRTLLDLELKKAGIAAQAVNGYDRTAGAHLAAAREVLRGRADCCVAPRIVARALGLDFIPLLSERYDLVMRRELLPLGSMQTFLNVLTSGELRRKLLAIGSYDTSATGRVVR